MIADIVLRSKIRPNTPLHSREIDTHEISCVAEDMSSSASSHKGSVRLVSKTIRLGMSVRDSTRMANPSACAIASSVRVVRIDLLIISAY